jgi:hypothetical protein
MGSFPYIGALFLILGGSAGVFAASSFVREWIEDAAFATCAGRCTEAALPAAVILALTFVPMGALFVWIGLPSRRSSKRPSDGRRTSATIVTLEDSGTRVMGYPYVKFQLQLEEVGMPPRMVSTGSVVRPFMELRPGDRIPVVVDHLDPGKVRIDLDK